MEPTYRIEPGVIQMTPIAAGSGVGTDLVIFSHPGNLSATLSPPFEPETTSSIRRIKVLLSNAGSTTTTLRFYISGVAFLDISLLAGETRYVEEDMEVEFVGDTDLLDVEVISIGTDAANLAVLVYGLT